MSKIKLNDAYIKQIDNANYNELVGMLNFAVINLPDTKDDDHDKELTLLAIGYITKTIKGRHGGK